MLALVGRPTTLWDVATGKKIGAIKSISSWNDHLRFAPEGQTLAIATHYMGVGTHRQNVANVRLVEVPSGKEVADLGEHPGNVQSLAFSQDGGFLAVSTGTVFLHIWDLGAKDKYQIAGSFQWFGNGSNVEIWKIAAGKPFHSFGFRTHHSADSMRIQSFLAICPSGPIVAGTTSAADDFSVQLRRLPAGRSLGSLTGHRGNIQAAAFSSDGKHLATASDDSTVLIWDVQRQIAQHLSRQVTLSADKLQQCWEDLGGTKEGAAAAAQERLVEASAQTLPLLRKMLRPMVADGMDRWVADLDSDDYEERETALHALERREFAAEPALRQALKGAPSLEQRRRVDSLLKKLEQPLTQPDVLRSWRSVTILEQIGNEDARQLLETLSRGSPHARFTQQIRAALDRWNQWPRLGAREAGQ